MMDKGKIAELYKQAHREHRQEYFSSVVDPTLKSVSVTRYFDHELFAALIVAHATECVRDVLRDEKSDLTYQAASQVQNRIKQHFGVEE